MDKNVKKINRENTEDILALTPMQEGLLYHYIKDDDSQYFQQLSLEITGELNIKHFEDAWQRIVELNELLRTVYRWEGLDKHIQIILREHRLAIRHIDFSSKEENVIPALIESLKQEDRQNKFDLTEVPFRITLCKVNNEKYVMIISNHHIIYDGWSTGVILKEFYEIYNCLNNGKPYVVNKKNKFKNFVKWLQNQDSQKSESYWKSYLHGLDTKTELSTRKEINSDARDIREYTFKMDKIKLDAFIHKNGLTLATIVYVAWGLLLQKYVDRDDVIFGVTVSGRNADVADIENMVGLFINTVPLRIINSSEEEVLSLLNKVQNEIQTREGYNFTPLVDIKKYSEFHNRDELFDSIIVIENYPLDSKLSSKNEGKLTFNAYSMYEVNNFNLTLGITWLDEEIEVCFSYNEKVFNHDYIERLANHFENLLDNMIQKPNSKVREIDMLSPSEKEKILYEFNDTKMDYTTDKTVHEWFEEQVERTPDHIALIYADQKITYKELNEKANQLARTLVRRGLKRNNVIGIMAERSIEMIVSILATLKAGGAYLPIGLEQPKVRKEYMLQNCEARFLLTQKHLIENDKDIVGAYPVENIIFTDDGQLYTGDVCNLNVESEPTDLVNIIYTSGTTGKPKGVMVTHANLLLYMESLFYLYETTSQDASIQLVPFSFDLFGEELFQAILKGGRFVIPQEHEAKDVHRLHELILKNNVSIVSCSPLLLNEFNKLPLMYSVKNFVSGGDVLKQEYIDNLKKNANIYNGYGPTEATIGATHYKVGDDFENRLSIGKPMRNYRVYILDKNQNLLPIGVPGELYISGGGVTKGYINNSEITKEKFLNDPFFSGSRMYKTGDLAMWRDDGNVDYISRIDQQIKIRGFRIEPGEIESQIREYMNVKETVVIATDDKQGNKYLCAFIISDVEIEINKLKAFLLKVLPDYMVPVQFIQIKDIPATSNGKIDKSKLSELAMAEYEVRTTFIEPRDDIEKDILAVWESVLKRHGISMMDDFFEIGGDSLKLTSIYSMLNKKFTCNISIQDLFDNRTIEALAKLIKERLGQVEKNIEVNDIDF